MGINWAERKKEAFDMIENTVNEASNKDIGIDRRLLSLEIEAIYGFSEKKVIEMITGLVERNKIQVKDDLLWKR